MVEENISLIEGIGDEVVYVMVGLLVVALLAIAWSSTGVAEQPFVRTAVLVITRCRHRTQPQIVSSSNATSGVGPPVETVAHEQQPSNVDNTSNQVQNGTVEQVGANIENIENVDRNVAPVSTEENVDILCDECETVEEEALEAIFDDGESSETTEQAEHPSEDASEQPSGEDQRSYIRRRRLQCLLTGNSNRTSNNNAHAHAHAREQAARPTKQGYSSQQEPKNDVHVEDERSSADAGGNLVDEDHIRVRIKFLNDTQLLVQARLNELLGEFRRRHFASELANNKIVRLIFNGQLLRSDEQTLQQFGLFDNCVVHCQISQGSSSSQASSTNANRGTPLDLANLMMPLFALLLALVWYARLYYRQLFNATSTLALVGITGLFLVSVISMFIPHRDRPSNPT